MSSNRVINMADTAENLVGIWDDHKLLLDRRGLSYIDSLLDVAVNAGAQNKAALRLRLVEMIPGMQFGTARRLVDLKYLRISEGQKLRFLQRR